MQIPFTRPYLTGRELVYIQQAIQGRHLSGNGPFAEKCQTWLENRLGCKRALLTHSGTAALEMAAILAEIGAGDEIIMPSFTFVSTANPFVLRGGIPVFVDIRPDTLCIDESQIEAAITPKTKAIAVVHYAGVSCEMDAICSLARQHNLCIIEDATHGICSSYRGRHLGSIGTFAALSFHETKNVVAGEGGALLINDTAWVSRAEIVQEKGTNRKEFLRGHTDHYSWMDLGSSYSPGEVTAAFLWAQLEQAELVIEHRLALWQQYHAAFADLEQEGYVRRPIVPRELEHNGHIYYLLLSDRSTRKHVIDELRKAGIGAASHYVPLHTSVGGRRFGRAAATLSQTMRVSDCLLRLPLWVGMSPAHIAQVRTAIGDAIARTGLRHFASQRQS